MHSHDSSPLSRLRELSGRLAPGAVAFVDREWAIPHASSQPALLVQPGEAHWRGAAFAPPADLPPERIAISLIDRFAVHTLSAMPPSNVIEVLGEGIVADRFRAAEMRTGEGGGHAVIDTTGDPQRVIATLTELPSGGILVLAGEALDRTADVDFYRHVHLHGHRVLGAEVSFGATVDFSRERPGFPPPVTVDITAPALPPAQWYRVNPSPATVRA